MIAPVAPELGGASLGRHSPCGASRSRSTTDLGPSGALLDSSVSETIAARSAAPAHHELAARGMGLCSFAPAQQRRTPRGEPRLGITEAWAVALPRPRSSARGFQAHL
jgi:hypothetical protein